jgi:flagellar protein FliO/FliZ
MSLPSRPFPAASRALRAAAAALLLCAAPGVPALEPADSAPAAASSPGAAPRPLLPAAPAAAPPAGTHPVEGPSFAPLGLSLLAVLAVMAAILWAMRRAGLAPRAGSAGLLRLVGQLSLGPRERVVIVEAGDRWFLLGVGATGVSRLAALPKGEAGTAAAAAASFSTLFERLRRGGA